MTPATPLRVALVCADRGISLGGAGGASAHLRALARAWARRACVEVWLARGDAAPVELPGVEVRVGPRGRLPGFLRKDPERDGAVDGDAFLRWAWTQARRFRPHLLHERHSLFGGLGRLRPRGDRTPLLLEVNAPLVWEGALFRDLPPRPSLLAREEAAWAYADVRVAVSPGLARLVDGLVVPNGAEPGPAARPGTTPPFVLGLAASFKPWHGVPEGATSLLRLQRQVGPLRVELVGDGPTLPATRAALDSLGIPHEAFGVLPDEAVTARCRTWHAAWSPRAPWPPPGAEPVASALGAPLPDRWFAPLKEAEAAAAGLTVWTGEALVSPAPAPTWDAVVDDLLRLTLPAGVPGEETS